MKRSIRKRNADRRNPNAEYDFNTQIFKRII